jgi:hypothetical protein
MPTSRIAAIAAVFHTKLLLANTFRGPGNSARKGLGAMKYEERAPVILPPPNSETSIPSENIQPAIAQSKQTPATIRPGSILVLVSRPRIGLIPVISFEQRRIHPRSLRAPR